MHSESLRQFSHIIAALVLIALFVGLGQKLFIVFGLLLIVFGFILVGMKNPFVVKIIKLLDRAGAGGAGAVYLMMGVLLTAMLFPEHFLPAILVMGVSDALATLIGINFGKYNLDFNKRKTWEGTAAFFVSASFILFFFSEYWLVLALIATAFETIDYSRFKYADDNLVLPVLVGLLLALQRALG